MHLSDDALAASEAAGASGALSKPKLAQDDRVAALQDLRVCDAPAHNDLEFLDRDQK